MLNGFGHQVVEGIFEVEGRIEVELVLLLSDFSAVMLITAASLVIVEFMVESVGLIPVDRFLMLSSSTARRFLLFTAGIT